jgi:MFS family permease
MSPVAAGLLVFAASASVLVLEILAVRLLAPYVGATLETYTAIIGVVLAGIAAGSWAGGRIADRLPPRRVLGPTLLLGGVLTLCVTPAVRLLGVVAHGGHPAAVVALAAAGFFAPAAVLSAVTPTVVKLQLADLARTGTVVGRLSAIGTAGAIVGTFVTGFLLVAALPTTRILLGLGAGLAGAGLALTLRPPGAVHGDQQARLPVGLIVAALGAGALGLLLGDPCQVQTPYFCARVQPDPARPGGRLLLLDDLLHSHVDLDDPARLELGYTRTIAGVLDTAGEQAAGLDALHIGGGGFTLPRWLAATRAGARSLVLELDPAVVRLARDRLGLITGPDLRVRTGDARLTLAEQPDRAFDAVVGDAFGGRAVPWHLTTREFATQVRRVLRPGGVYAVNVIDVPPLGFARAEAATLRAVFGHVAVLAPPERLTGREGGNFVLVASEAPLRLDAIVTRAGARGGYAAAAAGAELDRFVGSARVLTDDHAPVDQLQRRD